MKGSQYKPDKINSPNKVSGNLAKLIFFALSVTVAGTSAAEINAESSGTTYTQTADTYLSEIPDRNYIGLNAGNNINIYNGEVTDLVLFFAGNATKFKDNHVGISVSLSW